MKINDQIYHLYDSARFDMQRKFYDKFAEQSTEWAE